MAVEVVDHKEMRQTLEAILALLNALLPNAAILSELQTLNLRVSSLAADIHAIAAPAVAPVSPPAK